MSEKRRARRAAAAATAATPVDYTDSIVTFIDILGFRELVRARSANDMAKITRIVREAVSPYDDEDNEDVDLQVLAFSDSVIRVRRTSFLSAFFHELLAIVHMQAQLAVQGVLVRGAMTVGDVFANQSNAFGPAFVEAYELESRSALYPRVIIDKNLLTKFDSDSLGPNHNLMTWESAYVQQLLDVADDGFWFVDYLRSYDTELDHTERYVDYLRAHKDRIDDASSRANTPGVAAKIHWLSSYHNRVISELDPKQLAAHGATPQELMASTTNQFRFSRPMLEEVNEDRYWQRTTGPKASPVGPRQLQRRMARLGRYFLGPKKRSPL